MMLALAAFLLAVLVSWGATRAYLGWALRARFLDTPGARSSHRVPTPTGGGLGIVAGMAAGCALTAAVTDIGAPWAVVAALLPLLTLLGYLDDRRALAVAPRLLGQLAASAAVVLSLPLAGGIAGFVLAPALLLPVAVLWLAWLNNAFNFMDGIDGIAGAQALFMAGAAALLLGPGAGSSDSQMLLAGTAGAALGFLLLNWPPARLFMGDAGSQPLGFALAAATLVSSARGELSLAVWVILWAAFLVDASVTLAARAWRGQPLAEAHRDHAYQRLARRLGAHRPVTLGLLALDLLWLLPLARAAQAWPHVAWAIALLACAPLCGCALWLQRGREPAA